MLRGKTIDEIISFADHTDWLVWPASVCFWMPNRSGSFKDKVKKESRESAVKLQMINDTPSRGISTVQVVKKFTEFLNISMWTTA